MRTATLRVADLGNRISSTFSTQRLASLLSALMTNSRRSGSSDQVGDRQPSPWLVDEAKKVPNGWVYEIDGEFGVQEHVPREAIRGAWPVGPDGVITGEFVTNPNYRSAS